MRVLRGLALAALGLFAAAAVAQDYAREKRWEAEVTGNLVVGDAVKLKLASGHEFLALYTPVTNAITAVVLVHGIGVHPDHGVIGILRTALADLGYATLSIQMPVQASDAGVEAYTPAVFAEASERIERAGRWLRARGPTDVVLLSHSIGSRMSLKFWRTVKDAPYAAWVCLGIPTGFARLPDPGVPILDVYGEFDLRDVLAEARARARAIETIGGSRQIVIPGADHFYVNRELQLAAAIHAFLQERVTGRGLR